MKYRNGCIACSVRELCETALRYGDIDLRVPSVSAARLYEGAELHRKLQAERGDGYRSEVRLENRSRYGGIIFNVSGIADGISDRSLYAKTYIEEIKTVSGRLPDDPDIRHLAQLRAYGYFYCVENGFAPSAKIHLCLTYYSVSGENTKTFDLAESTEALRMHYENLLSLVLPRAEHIVKKATVRLPYTEKNSTFPYAEVREGQDELIRECYRVEKNGKRLFAQAPTGIGKTLSVMYPTVRALSEGHCDRIFYLTAKASIRREAFAAAKQLFENGADIYCCVITARDSMCLCEPAKASGRISAYCNPDDCPYAKGYYERADGAVFSMLEKKNGFTRDMIVEVAKKHRVCPYELSLDLSEFCELIICDYNYVFDPSVYLRRYFIPDIRDENNVFLIDEAHNLPDRVRSMYSFELLRSDFEGVYALTGSTEAELDRSLEKMIAYMRGLRKLCRDNLVKAPDGERGFFMTKQTLPGLSDVLTEFVRTAEQWRRANREHTLYDTVSRLSGEAKKYLILENYYDDRFLTYTELFGGDTRIRVFCLDPSHIINEKLRMARSSVLFSATLTPLDYFKELCGGKNSATLDLKSPFSEEKLCIAAVDTISTRAEDRNERTCRKLAVYIAATVSARAGNYICYFPSYDFMEKVLEQFKKKYKNVDTIVQRRGMTISERESFLSEFKNDKGVLRVGFCVLGGSFSEGVDLPGDRLIGSIIIGVGIPGISNERNLLRDYYELHTERGYDYAYTYPGMNSVLQAAGRVIRCEEDRGIVVLIDDRYGTPQYAAMFPEQWNGLKFAGNPSSLAELAGRFWGKSKK